VALTPRSVATLVAAGHAVVMPPGAGIAAGFTDDAFRQAGAEVVDSTAEADLAVGIGPLTLEATRPAKAVLGFLDPLGSSAEISRFADAGVAALALELVPRSTLAQSMDALSSQATSAGYEAVLLGAFALPRFMPMMMTAAGTIRPARVLVLGAGVAGLQAIATARRLGAMVSGYDIRPAAREQVESLGAKFVGGPVLAQAEQTGGYAGEVDEATRRAQQAALAAAVTEADLIVSTAQVPGRRAPLLITTGMVETMKPGSVIIDLAASTGGNCELTRLDEEIRHHGITVYGPFDLAVNTAGDASEMFGRNVVSLVTHLSKGGALTIDTEDEIARSVCVARDGRVTNDAVLEALGGG
jgi:NAD(P) transhydrogenase subunit alpha